MLLKKTPMSFIRCSRLHMKSQPHESSHTGRAKNGLEVLHGIHTTTKAYGNEKWCCRNHAARLPRVTLINVVLFFIERKRSALQNTRFKFWQYRTFFRHTHIHTQSISANAAQQFRDFLGGINDFCTIYFGTAIIAMTRNGSTGLSRVDGISWNRSSTSPFRSRSCVSWNFFWYKSILIAFLGLPPPRRVMLFHIEGCSEKKKRRHCNDSSRLENAVGIVFSGNERVATLKRSKASCPLY
jgi:hypothetical protein